MDSSECAGENGNKQKEDLHVKFDEAVIKEHDKLRGTRQKIDEPSTPYHRGSFDEFVEDYGDSRLRSKGKVVFDDQLITASDSYVKERSEAESGLSTLQAVADRLSTADASLTPLATCNARHDQFLAKRKSHYNEFEVLRKWREDRRNGVLSDEEE